MNEEDGIATVMIGVLSGTLQRDVSLAISLSGGSALGELNSIMLLPNWEREVVGRRRGKSSKS